MKNKIHWIFWIFAGLCGGVFYLWSLGFLCYGVHGIWKYIALTGFFINTAVLVYWRKNWRMCLISAVFFIFIPVGYGLMRPDAELKFQSPWQVMPEVIFDGNQVVIKNFRDFRYRSENDYDANYIEEKFDLNKVEKMILAISHWDNLEKIAHSMLGFRFSDGRYLIVSDETRKPEGASDDFLAGIYNQYQSIIVLGSATDLLRLREKYRREKLYLYGTNATKEEAQIILRDLLNRAEDLRKNPKFYNTLSNNCTTSLLPSIRLIRPDLKGDIRFIFNGLSDEMAYERGWLSNPDNLTFPELKQQAKEFAYLLL